MKLFKKLKEIGYDGVEFAGWCNLDVETVKKALDEAGLVAVGCHVPVESFDTDEKLYEVLKTVKALGTNTCGVGGAPYKTKEDIEYTGRVFRRANEIGEKEGIKFYYHNHWGEFEYEYDGELAEDIIAKDAYLELDIYWCFHAGADNCAYIRKYKDRIAHLHLKDGIDGTPTALGEGNCNIKEVMALAKEIGMEWVIIENDKPVPTGIEDLARSLEFFKANI